MRPFPPKTTLLDTAKWNRSLADETSISTNHAHLKPLRHAPHPANIPREEISCQADITIVGEAQDLLLGFELDEGCEGTKGLFSVDEGILWDVAQDGGDEEVGVGNGLAANKNLSALGDCVVDMAFNFLDCTRVNEGPMGPGRRISTCSSKEKFRRRSRSLFETVSDFESSDSFGKPGRKLSIHARLNVDAIGADTCLTAPSELADNCG